MKESNINNKFSLDKLILKIVQNKNFDVNKADKILNIKRKIVSKIKDTNNFDKLNEFQRVLINFTNSKGRKNCEKYLAWHIAVGSTPDENVIQALDFEDEDNIENLLEKFFQSF